MNITEIPQYRCHKIVRAAKIMGITNAPPSRVAPEGSGGTWDIELQAEVVGDAPMVEVTHAWLTKHKPEVGGYYVIYEDGYASFSPAAAFEAGYALIEPEPSLVNCATASGMNGEAINPASQVRKHWHVHTALSTIPVDAASCFVDSLGLHFCDDSGEMIAFFAAGAFHRLTEEK